MNGRKYAVEISESPDPVREAIHLVEDAVDLARWPEKISDLQDLLLLKSSEVPKSSSVFNLSHAELSEMSRPAKFFFDKISGFHCRPLLKGQFLKEELADPEFFFQQISDLASPFFDEYLMVEEKKSGRSEILREKGNFFFSVCDRLNRVAEISVLPSVRDMLEVREARGNDHEILLQEISDLPMSFPTRETLTHSFGLAREELVGFSDISDHPVHLWAQRALGKTGDVELPTFEFLTENFRLLPNRKFMSFLSWLGNKLGIPEPRFLPTRELARKLRNFSADRKVAVTGPWAQAFAKQSGWSEIPCSDRKLFADGLAGTRPNLVIITGLPPGADSVTDLIRASPGVSAYLILGPKPGTGCPQKTWGERPWWGSRKKFPLISPRNGFTLGEVPDIGCEILCPEDSDYVRFGGAWLWTRLGQASLLEGNKPSSLEA